MVDRPVFRELTRIVAFRRYASIEWVKAYEGFPFVDWCMATTSDAKGKLPVWLQKKAMLGAIAKDVGLFIKWREQQRNQA